MPTNYGYFINKYWGIGDDVPVYDSASYAVTTFKSTLTVQVPPEFFSADRTGVIVDLDFTEMTDKKEKGVALEFIDKIDHIVTKGASKQDTALHEKIEVSEKVVLTERELETIELLATGLRNKEIGNKLFISESTVKRHVYNMSHKLDTKGRVELINKSRTLGYIK